MRDQLKEFEKMGLLGVIEVVQSGPDINNVMNKLHQQYVLGDTSNNIKIVVFSSPAERFFALLESPDYVDFRNLLLEMHSMGNIGGFCIDEAHLITMWGKGFRPDFLNR